MSLGLLYWPHSSVMLSLHFCLSSDARVVAPPRLHFYSCMPSLASLRSHLHLSLQVHHWRCGLCLPDKVCGPELQGISGLHLGSTSSLGHVPCPHPRHWSCSFFVVPCLLLGLCLPLAKEHLSSLAAVFVLLAFVAGIGILILSRLQSAQCRQLLLGHKTVALSAPKLQRFWRFAIAIPHRGPQTSRRFSEKRRKQCGVAI